MLFHTETRLLAHWRTRQAPAAWFELLPLLRRGLAAAGAAGVMLAVLSFTTLKPSPADAWTLVNRMANTTCAP